MEELMALEVCLCGHCEELGHEKERYRPLTADEIAQREAEAITWAEQKAAEEAALAEKAAQRQAVLTALAAAAGLTVEEVQAALS